MVNFNEEFYRITNLIEKKDSFVFVRYGDGEVMLMDGLDVTENTQAYTIDKWSSRGMTRLGEKLNESLIHTEKSWYYGIPCQCCNLHCKEILLKRLKVPYEQISYANIWVNSNYKHFIEWIRTLNKTKIVLIANQIGVDNEYPFIVDKYISAPYDCVNFFEKEGDVFINKIKELTINYKNTIFLVSAGPLSEVIIHELFLVNPNNKYIDVGSSLDEYIHKKKTRPYMIPNNQYNLKICNF